MGRFCPRFFNLIEVVLAITVFAVGILAVLALIPIGRSATKNNIAMNYAADSAEMLLNHLSENAKSNWATTVTGINSESTISVVNDLSGLDAEAADPYGSTHWTYVTDNLYQRNTDTKLFRATFAKSRDDAGTTRRTMQFDALLRVWKSPVTTFDWDAGSTTQDIGYSKAMQVNVEVLWPVSSPQSDRHSEVFSIQVYKAN